MGYAVMHMEKAKGSDSGMSSHIERKHNVENADHERTHLNQELIEFTDGVTNRSQAISHRLETAGLTRKIGSNQVRAVRILLTGSNHDMKRIEQAGQLDKWCADNVLWLQKTFGRENLVSAVLHMDEKTPHIHATVVPIVKGQRRKANEKKPGKKEYRKKSPNATRLCADDVMSRVKLKEYQNTYAEAMNKYGLQRGIEGSEANHISTREFYTNAINNRQSLQEDVGKLIEQKEMLQEQERCLYDSRNEARDNLNAMESHVRLKERELADLEQKAERAERKSNPDKNRKDLELLLSLKPELRQILTISGFCIGIGVPIDEMRIMLGGQTVFGSGSLYSYEYKRRFQIENGTLRIDKDPSDPRRLSLFINGQDHVQWFREKYKDEMKKIGIDLDEIERKQTKSRSMR